MPFDLNAEIDRALASNEPDPHVLAARVMRRIPDDMLRDILSEILVERVTLRMRSYRHDAGDAGYAEIPAPVEKGRRVGRSKFRVYMDRHCIAGEWKMRPDWTIEDVRWIRHDYQSRADANARMAARFVELEERMVATGVQTVGELDALDAQERAA